MRFPFRRVADEPCCPTKALEFRLTVFHGAGHLLASTRVAALMPQVVALRRISWHVPSMLRSYASVAQTTGFGAGSALGLTMMLISPVGRTVALPPFAPS